MAQYTITEEQIKELAKWKHGKRLTLEWFPEVFENKLEVGKWYKFNVSGFNYLLCYSGGEKSYGFFNKKYGSWYLDNNKKYAFGNEATNEEVEAALKSFLQKELLLY